MAKTMSAAERFSIQYHAAIRAAYARYGDAWTLQSNGMRWGTLPKRLRNYKTERGTTIKCNQDIKLPSWQFWPKCIPTEIQISPPYKVAVGPVRDARYQTLEQHQARRLKWEREQQALEAQDAPLLLLAA